MQRARFLQSRSFAPRKNLRLDWQSLSFAAICALLMLYVAPAYGAIGKTRQDFDPAYAALRTVRPAAFFADFFAGFFSTGRLTAALRAEDPRAAEPSVAAPLPPLRFKLARNASMMSITFALAGAAAPSGTVISSPSTFF